MSWKKIRAGVGLLRAGKNAEALRVLEQAAAEMPNDPRSFVQLGLARLETEQPLQALESLQQALTLHPNHPPALYYLCLCHLDLDDLEQAARVLGKLEACSPENQALPTLRTLLCLRRGEVDQALTHLEIPPCPPSPIWKRPELSSFGPLVSRLSLEVEEWLLPLEIPRLRRSQAAKEAPAEPEGVIPKAQDKTRSGVFGFLVGFLVGLVIAIGMRILMRLVFGPELDFDPMTSAFFLLLMVLFVSLSGALWGMITGNLHHHTQAYMAQLKGYRLLDRSIKAGAPVQREQLFMLAIQNMRRVLQLDDSLLRSHYGLGEALLFTSSSLRQPEISDRFLPEAEAQFLESWRQDGENPYLNYYLGRSCQLQGKLEAAIEYYQRAISKFSKLSEGHFGLGQCHVMMGDRAEARKWLSRALGSELQLARDRLQDLGHCYSEGMLGRRPAMPAMPPPEPESEVFAVPLSSPISETEEEIVSPVPGT